MIYSVLSKVALPRSGGVTYRNLLIVKKISSSGMGIVLGPEALRIP